MAVPRRVVIACVLAVALAGCGGGAGDLVAIEASGGPERERGDFEVVVADNGIGSCNRGEEQTLSSALLIDAREVERELSELAEDGARYDGSRRAQRRYVARMKAGTVRWAEGEPGLPAALPRAQLLALRLERELCR